MNCVKFARIVIGYCTHDFAARIQLHSHMLDRIVHFSLHSGLIVSRSTYAENHAKEIQPIHAQVLPLAVIYKRVVIGYIKYIIFL